MKVLLISANLARDPYPVYPFGISVISAAMKDRGIRTELYDPLSEEDYPALTKLADRIASFQPDVIGIGIRNVDSINSLSDEKNLLAPAVAIARFCRKAAPDRPLILGGGGFTLIPEEILDLCGADWGISGPGEDAFPMLAEKLLSGNPPKERVLYAPSTESTPRSGDFPDRLASYYARETHMLPIQFKRGCPFHCSYCSYPALEGGKIRFRDPDETAEEMRVLHERYPDTMLFFTDSVFNDPADGYLDLLDRLDGSIPYSGFLSPFRLDSRAVDRLARSGMISAELGIDGAADETLEGLGKNFTFAEAARSARDLHDAKIAVTANFMFGGPGETYDTIRRGIENIRSLDRIWSVIFSGVRILPHTPLYDRAVKLGMVPPDWNPADELYYYEPGVDRVELDRALTEAFADSPYCIWPPHAKRELLSRIHRIGLPKYRKLFGGTNP